MKNAVILFALMLAAPVQATDLLGISIGQKFNLPECAVEKRGYRDEYIFWIRQPTTPCWQHSILKGGPGDPLDSSTSFEIYIIPPGEKKPAGIVTSGIKAVVVEGVIQGVIVETSGYEYQNALYELLVEKYGKPALIGNSTDQNRMGASFDNRTATWKLKDSTATFLGMIGSTEMGMISLMSPAGAKWIEDEAKRRKAAGPSL